MPIGILFWILMLLWLAGMIWASWPLSFVVIPNLFLFLVIAILGWKVFGPAVQK